jgi:hypothetical protein
LASRPGRRAWQSATQPSPRPTSDIPTPHIDGKTPDELVDELLTIYPDGGADPSRAQLETMMHFPGFRDQPVHYIKV